MIKGKQKGAIKSSVWREAIEGKRWKERKSWGTDDTTKD